MSVAITFCFLLLGLGRAHGSEFYKREYLDSTLWTPFEEESLNSVKSFFECAAICNKRSHCRGFHFDSTRGCTFASRDANCVKTNSSQEVIPIHTFHGYELPSGWKAHVVELSSAEQKTLWQAEASAVYTNSIFYPINAIDGSNFGGMYVSDNDAPHNWLQVTMDMPHWVKGFRYRARNENWVNRATYIEVRVGNADISGSTNTERLCQNQFCATTGNHTAVINNVNCASPVFGQIITLQRHKSYSNGNNFMELIELDVIIFCGPFMPQDDFACMPEMIDHCSNRELATGETFLADTALDRSGWSVSASSVEGNQGPENVLDQDYGTLFHSNMEGAVDDTFPWIQIDFGSSNVVKAVILHSRTDTSVGEEIMALEVRVGDTDVSTFTPLGQRICENILCKLTAATGIPANVDMEDCSGGPLLGRYVTLQRFGQGNGPEFAALVVAQVDVEFFI